MDYYMITIDTPDWTWVYNMTHESALAIHYVEN